MIAKIKTGTGFSGVLNYSLKEEKKAEIIDKNMIGETPRQLANEFKLIADSNTRASKKMKHIILSFADEDRHKLTPDKMKEISKEFTEKMGYKNCQYVTVRHTDNAHEHLHIIVNRIDPTTGKAVKDGNEKYRGSRIARELELKHDLKPTPSEKQEETKRESKEEIEVKKRLASENGYPDKAKIKAVLEREIKKARSMPRLVENLRKTGLKVHLTTNKKGNTTGWKFEYKNREYKASTIDRNLSWANATRRVEENKNRGIKL